MLLLVQLCIVALFLCDCWASPTWSFRRLSSRTVPTLVASVDDDNDLNSQYYGEIEVLPRRSGRVPGQLHEDEAAVILSRIVRRGFAGENVIAMKDRVFVDVPATVCGRDIFQFKSKVKMIKQGKTVVMDLRTPPIGTQWPLLFWTKRKSCRVILSVTAINKVVYLKLRISSTGVAEKQLNLISEYLFNAVYEMVSTELKIAEVRQKWLRMSAEEDALSERRRASKALKEIIEPERFNRLTTAPSISASTGSRRYTVSTALQDRRSPPIRGGGG